MKRVLACVIGGVVLLGGQTGLGQSAFLLYDNFDRERLNPERWLAGGGGPPALEVFRGVADHALRLSNRSYGETNGDAGSQTGQVFVSFANAAAAIGIEATVRVDNLRVDGCTTNSIPTYVDANIFGAYFNSGVPAPPSHTGDVTAALRVSRRSTDPPDVLEISATVTLCRNADCSLADLIGAADVGTTTRKESMKLRVDWDALNDRFAFTRDDSAPVFITYQLSDSAPAGNPNKILSTVADVPNCTTAPRPAGFIRASFDNVFVRTRS